MSVLVLSEDFDPTVDAVIDELRLRAVEVFRCDTAWFPARMSVSAELDDERWAGSLVTADRCASLVDLRSVWYRRPTAFVFPDEMSGPERRHAAWEAKLGFGGVLADLPALWVNHPSRETMSYDKSGEQGGPPLPRSTPPCSSRPRTRAQGAASRHDRRRLTEPEPQPLASAPTASFGASGRARPANVLIS